MFLLLVKPLHHHQPLKCTNAYLLINFPFNYSVSLFLFSPLTFLLAMPLFHPFTKPLSNPL